MNASVLPGEDTEDLTPTRRPRNRYRLTGGTIDNRRPRPSTPADPEMVDLVNRAQAGDKEAFGLIYDRHIGVIFRYVASKVDSRQQAEDITADVFLRAMRRISAFQWQGPNSNFAAWLTTIASNLVIDYYRSARNRTEIVNEDYALKALVEQGKRLPAPAADVSATDYLRNLTLVDAVNQLRPDQRECVLLRFWHGLTVAEAADRMGKSESAVKSLQFRAIRELFAMLPVGFER